MLLPRVRLSPVIGTRDARGNGDGKTCTETQYINECRVGGWPGSFSTACGQDGPAGATFAWHAQASVWLQAWAAGAIPYLVTTC